MPSKASRQWFAASICSTPPRRTCTFRRGSALPTPRYYHLPVVVNERRQKLSKQTGAQPIDAGEPEAAANVLELLGLSVPAELRRERPGVLWRWALDHWNIDALRGRRELAQR